MNLKKIFLLFLMSVIGAFLISLFVVTGVSPGNENLSLIGIKSYSPILVVPMVIIPLLFGSLASFIFKPNKGFIVLKMSFITGFVTIIIYAIITFFTNLNYLVSPRGQHYAWSGLMGYIGDAIFMIIVVIFVFGLYLIPLFIIGGFTGNYIRKRNIFEENN